MESVDEARTIHKGSESQLHGDIGYTILPYLLTETSQHKIKISHVIRSLDRLPHHQDIGRHIDGIVNTSAHAPSNRMKDDPLYKPDPIKRVQKLDDLG